MLRIVILNQNAETAQRLFQTAQAVIRRLKLRCELFKTTDPQAPAAHLDENIGYYDILVLDAGYEPAVQLARSLRRRNLTASLVFTGAANDEIRELLRYRMTAEVDPQDLRQTVQALRYCCMEQMRSRQYFNIRSKDSILRVDFRDIRYIESRQRIAAVHTERKIIEFYAKLTDIESSLPQDDFIRCHQSYIVNMNHVGALDREERCFRLRSGGEVDISRSNYAQVLEQYTAFLENH